MSAFRCARSLPSVSLNVMKVSRFHQRRVVSLAIPAMQQTLSKLSKTCYQDACIMPVNKFDLSGTCGVLSASCSALFSTSAETLSEETEEVQEGDSDAKIKWPSPEYSTHLSKSKSVFIGGYNFDYNEIKLEKLFSQFGEVSAVTIPLKSVYDYTPVKENAYRFAFIHFKYDDSVTNALQVQSITTATGETVEIKKRSKSKRELEKDRTFVFNNLPNDITANKFIDHFKVLGDIELANLVLNSPSKDSDEKRSYAFVVFKATPDLNLILNSSIKIDSNEISIQKIGKTARTQQRERCQKVFIENLQMECTEEMINNYFQAFGTIDYTKIFENTKSAIIQFSKYEEAVDACKELNHTFEENSVLVRNLGWIENQQELEQ